VPFGAAEGRHVSFCERAAVRQPRDVMNPEGPRFGSLPAKLRRAVSAFPK
jgi:hypothetical protein